MQPPKALTRGALGAMTLLIAGATATSLAQEARVIQDHPWCAEMLERNSPDNDKSWACEVREMTFDVVGDAVRASASPNGGISVTPGDGDEITLVAKIGAQAPTLEEAQALVDEVTIERVDGVIRAIGREREDDDESQWSWWASFELQAPAYSNLELSSVNGGIDIDNIEGDIDAQTVNGGIDILGCAGAIVAESVNGGIDVTFASGVRLTGDIDLSTTNGGIDLTIPAGSGAELDLSTHMGSIDVPSGFEASERSRRVVRGVLGKGGPTISASTHLGGIDVNVGED